MYRWIAVRSVRTLRRPTPVSMASDKPMASKTASLHDNDEAESPATPLPAPTQTSPMQIFSADSPVFKNNPAFDMKVKKIWASTPKPRKPVPHFSRFEDLLLFPEVKVFRSCDSPPVFELRDIIPVHAVVEKLLNSFACMYSNGFVSHATSRHCGLGARFGHTKHGGLRRGCNRQLFSTFVFNCYGRSS